MANIEARHGKKGTTYRARVRTRGEVRTATFRRKTDAVQWAREAESRLAQHKYVPDTEAQRRTVADAIDFYLEEILPDKPRNKDAASKISRLKWWRDQIGNVTFIALKPETIKKKLSQLGRKLKPQTVKHYRNALSNVYTELIRTYHWTRYNPVKDVPPPLVKNGRTRFLDEDEIDRLLNACRNSQSDSLYDVVVLALSTGMRFGEILGLQWKDVDLKRGKITIGDGKNDDSRVVPLQGEGWKRLRQRVSRFKGDWVFPSQDGTKPAAIRTSFYNALKRAGIDDFKFHDLRHTASSWLAMNGATLSELAEILGHKTLAMVKRYSHFTEAHTSELVKRMNKKMFQ